MKETTRSLPATWQIKFELENVNPTGHYTFQLDLASAHLCALQVKIFTFI